MLLLSHHKQIKAAACIKTVPQLCGIIEASRIARFALDIIKKYSESGLFAFDPAVMTFLTALAREEIEEQKGDTSEPVIKREDRWLETIINKTSFIYMLRNSFLGNPSDSPSDNSAYNAIFNMYLRRNVFNPPHASFSFNVGQSFTEHNRRYFIAYGKNMRQTLNKMEQNMMALTTYDYLKIKSAILSMSEYSKGSSGNPIDIKNVHIENTAARDGFSENAVTKETLLSVMQSVAMGNLLFISEMFSKGESLIFGEPGANLQTAETAYESAKMLFRQSLNDSMSLTDTEVFQKQARFMKTEFHRLYEKLETAESNKSVIRLETREKTGADKANEKSGRTERETERQTEREIQLIYNSLSNTQRIILNKLLSEKHSTISDKIQLSSEKLLENEKLLLNEEQFETLFYKTLTNSGGNIYALETELKLLESKISEAYETLLSFENIAVNMSERSFEDIINDNGVSNAITNQLNETIKQIKTYRQINDYGESYAGDTAIYNYPRLSFVVREPVGHNALAEQKAEQKTEQKAEQKTEQKAEHETKILNRLTEFERSVTYALEHFNTAIERKNTIYENYSTKIIENGLKEAYKSFPAIPILLKSDAAREYFFKSAVKSYPRKYYPSLTGIYYESLAGYVKNALISVSKPPRSTISLVNNKTENTMNYNMSAAYETAINPPAKRYISVLNSGNITTVAGKIFQNAYKAFKPLDNRQTTQNDYALYNDNVLNINSSNITNTPQSTANSDAEQAQINVLNLINDFKLNRQEHGQSYKPNRLVVAGQNQDTKTAVFEQAREIIFTGRQKSFNDERLETQDRIIGDLSNKIENYENTIDIFKKEQENLNQLIEENSISRITSVLLGKLSKDLRMERLRRGLE